MGMVRAPRRLSITTVAMSAIVLMMVVVLVGILVFAHPGKSAVARHGGSATHAVPVTPTVTATHVVAFDPDKGALLPYNRVVAFYGEWQAEPAGPAFELSDTMLNSLKQQGAAYAALDPTHPLKLGIDYVADIADPCGGPGDTACSHEMDPSITQAYIDFCQKNNLVLFIDLEFGRANPRAIIADYLPYLEKYDFVHLAIDPEWYVGPAGYPGVNVGQMSAADINWAISQLAAIPATYHLSRKVLLIHEFRAYVLADKQNIALNPLVSLVLHVDSVGFFAGAIPVKEQQYDQWVRQELLQYGGFKLFYDREAPFNSLMTPQQVMSLFPQPLIVTYGN